MWRATSAMAAGIIVAVGIGSAWAADPIVGRASVIDGDTIEVQRTHIRLQGVDTPESAQICRDGGGTPYRCGQVAALALADRIGANNVSCEPVTLDRYGRTVAVCRLGAEDLNAWLVERGLGLAFRRYSKAYVAQEDAARIAKRGLWAGTFTPPWDWRRGTRGPADDPRAVSGLAPDEPPSPLDAARAAPIGSVAGTCAIKGNINRRGDHIYHVPGSRDYDRTVISADAGERMFCTEDEARAAGWRAPLR